MNPDALNSALSSRRKGWFAHVMTGRRNDFTSYKELSIFAGTWNVNGRSPEPSLDLIPWLFPLHPRRKNAFDVYMLGLQEVQTLSGIDAVRTDTMRGYEWTRKIRSLLDDEYQLIGDEQLVGIMLLVFVRKNHLPFLSNVRKSTAATGFLNTVGNKGGIAMRFQLYDRSISCVACHLSAHTGNVDRRNQDFRDVVRKAVFEHPDVIDDSPTASSNSLPDARLQEPKPSWSWNSTDLKSIASAPPQYAAVNGAASTTWLDNMKYVRAMAASAIAEFGNGPNSSSSQLSTGIFEHDVVFWLGDLNYRIDAPLENVMAWIQQQNWAALRKSDELQLQMRTSDIFTGFREGLTNFPPTYKFERFSDKYATDENGEFKRTPAYTDRILWKPGVDHDGKELQVRLKRYECCKVYSSDHRPVYAHFGMNFGIEDKVSKSRVQAEVDKAVDRKMNKYLPNIQIEPSPVPLGYVTYGEACEARVTLKNMSESGKAHVKISTTRPYPEWLLFDSSRWRNVVISPGSSAHLILSALVGYEHGVASRIIKDGCMLNTTLEVFIEPGRVCRRIDISGRYVPTTLGLPLEMLSMMSRPVRSLRRSSKEVDSALSVDRQDLDNYAEDRSHPSALPLAVPKEIWLLVDALLRVHPGDDESYMNRFPNLFLQESEKSEMQEVLSFIDEGEAIPYHADGHAVASCLVEVLKNLEDRVIPQIVYRRVMEAGKTEDPMMVHALVQMLPPINVNMFWYIIGLLCQLRSVKKQGDDTTMIAQLFGNVLLPRPPSKSLKDVKTRTSFILAAIRYRQSVQPSTYQAVIDLKRPMSHPKRISTKQAV
ncbi:Inositol polyphosphate 5-phosphatase OCRL-1 [Gracilariopsis chorda]|uniref:Inositol polyphosphate 5-phosphatase OCRL-1 n=1 Tax=Gracilariopsis chorda TaxID=448386 RepID=A0A2V3J472_9FLOR|nr:Inositol polyphosphate 5-phosphatase OCRL-1 [Gracilariopsis chorda]|eukprot:PXF49179.1 Inositol polyphosphate 5-phosphatase OCRL-1 [Gracilariopsis chorda]